MRYTERNEMAEKDNLIILTKIPPITYFFERLNRKETMLYFVTVYAYKGGINNKEQYSLKRSVMYLFPTPFDAVEDPNKLLIISNNPHNNIEFRRSLPDFGKSLSFIHDHGKSTNASHMEKLYNNFTMPGARVNIPHALTSNEVNTTIVREKV